MTLALDYQNIDQRNSPAWFTISSIVVHRDWMNYYMAGEDV